MGGHSLYSLMRPILLLRLTGNGHPRRKMSRISGMWVYLRFLKVE